MPKLIHKQMALKKEIPPNSGRAVRYRRYTNLATATVPLPDSGLTPPGQILNAVDIDARLDWYGSYVTITDQVMFINQDPVLNQTVSLLAQSMRETEDELTRNMLASTASQFNCVGGVNGDNPTEQSRSDYDTLIFQLLTNDAIMISDNIEGSLKFGTAPKTDGRFKSSLIDLEALRGDRAQALLAA